MVRIRAFLFIAAVSVVLLFTVTDVSSYRVAAEKDALAYLTYFGYVDPKEMPLGFTLKDCNKKLKEFQNLARVEVTGSLDTATLKAMNSPRCGCPDFIPFNLQRDYVDPYKTSRHNESTTSDESTRYHHRHHRSHGHFDHHYDHDHDHDKNSSFSDYRRNTRTNGGNRRTRRYVLANRKWDKKVVTYSIVKYPSRHDIKISAGQVEEAVQKAFHIWEQHINLQFQYRPNEIEVDIEISFASTYHGDSYPFDGPGNTLAHAFFPGSGLGGDVHFEEEEDWRLNTYGGIDFLYVAVHEIGHSLGLGHSSDYGAIMYPMYRGYNPNLQLHEDDKRGVQEIYGRPTQHTTQRPNTTPKSKSTTTTRTTTKKPVTTSSTTTTVHPGSDNHLCEDPTIDAIITLLDNAIFVFKGSNVYEIGRNQGVLSGWPKRISSYFRGLADNLDCALTRLNGKTYFFKGNKYWRFTGTQMDKGYPRSIQEYFPGIPNDLDAAFEWDDEFVFVKGDKFWRFNTRKRPQVQPFFPMELSHWGLYDKINAAFTAPDRSVYFFQGSTFWEFNKTSHTILYSQNSTGSVAETWFGCWEP